MSMCEYPDENSKRDWHSTKECIVSVYSYDNQTLLPHIVTFKAKRPSEVREGESEGETSLHNGAGVSSSPRERALGRENN